MEAWRDRGYVPDSDDDEELESQGTKYEQFKDKGPAAVDRNEVQSGDVNAEEDCIYGETKQQSQPIEVDSDNDLNAESSFDHSVRHSFGSPILVNSPSADIELGLGVLITSSEDEIQVVTRSSPHLGVDSSKSPAVRIEDIFPNDDSSSSLSPVPSTEDSLESAQPNLQPPEDRDHLSQQIPTNNGTDVLKVDEAFPNDVDSLALSEIPAELLHESSHSIRRSFRPRRLIQLHPYQLEDARYRGQFKNAGIKPVRVPLIESATADSQEKSQEDVFDERGPPLSSPPSELIYPPSSPPEVYMSPRSARRRGTPNTKSHESSGQRQPPSHKRRKLFHNGEERDKRQQSASIRVVIDKAEIPMNNYPARPTDLPPSPPRSGSVSSAATLRKDGFRFPRGFTPPRPTPAGTAPQILQEADGSYVHDEMEVDRSVEVADESSIRDEDDQEEDDQEEDDQDIADVEVRQLQRRIKGVLPASWLRLDLKHQVVTTDKEKQKRYLHDTQAGPLKGVAKKVYRARNTTIQSPTPRPSFDTLRPLSESSDSDDDIQTSRDNHKGDTPADFLGFDSPLIELDDDIPEDNRIDDMFPPAPRLSFSPKKRRSKQLKTHSTKRASHIHHLPARSHIRRQTRIEEHNLLPKHRSPRNQVPRLGILDAPDVIQRSQKEQPQFLRVASRQARARRDRGRSSPSGKFLQMATREETREINQHLSDWKKGAMKQTKLPAMAKPLRDIRQPLRNLSANTPIATGRRNPATLPHVSKSEARTTRLEDRDLASRDMTRAHPVTVSAAKEQTLTTYAKYSRVGNIKIIPRQHTISSLKRVSARPVESEEASFQNESSNFSAHLAALSRTDRKQSDTINRFFASMKPSSGREHFRTPLPQDLRPGFKDSATINQTRRKIPRKRAPTHAEMIDVDPMPQVTASMEPQKSVYVASADYSTSTNNSLHGLKNYRTFSVDFGILPLQRGTFFHSSTFIGDGGFARSLNVDMRNMDHEVGVALIEMGEHRFHWGAWNEVVSSEIGMIFRTVVRENEIPDSASRSPSKSDNIQTFISVINYITDKLYFIDPIDRISLVERLELLIRELKDHVAMMASTGGKEWELWLRMASLSTILANQLQQIASHEVVSSSKHESTLVLVKDLSRQLLSLVFSQRGLEDIRQFYNRNHAIEFRESGIRDDQPAVEAYAIAFQLLHSSENFKGWFKELTLSIHVETVSIMSIKRLEETWEAIFTTTPLNEIDRFGVAHPGLRFRDKRDNWPVVQALVSKVLDAYGPNLDQPAYYIKYCHVVFQRCLILLVSWGWRDCKIILETLFDFYAKNMMYNLKTEQSFGSPSFLESLDTNPLIEIEAGDSSFHLFIKIIGSGLRYLSQVTEKRTMRNIAWRLLPNHGRVYPKEKPLDHEDLNALRNHHDLLCTLYWAVPDGCRPRLETIRNLIDPATSHLETCNLSIRSWRRLVHFKLSTNEENAGLKPFADWYTSFTSELVRQHQLAKTEVEAQAKGHMQFSRQDVESTISHNQRKIEAIISSTIAAMGSAIRSSRSFDQACPLIEGVPFVKLFGLFDPANSRVNPVVSETLQLIIDLFSKDSSFITATVVNDDSQEYGDWSAIEEVYDDAAESAEPTASTLKIPQLQEVIKPSVAQLLSNCFGEDRSPEDSLLLKLTECWSYLAYASVRSGLHHWDTYLNQYSKDSWTSLRMTSQTKKFAPLFLASCLKKDSRFFTECRLQILTMWVSSLVERTSALKFQGRLTEVLLNVYDSPLLRNPPFHRAEDGRYHITLPEFTKERGTLISSLLSNMREHLQNLDKAGARSIEMRNEYKELVMALMISMKANYQELTRSGKSAQGEYVGFVHSIIGFIQQHSQSICRVDNFFTEPASFPLPSNDPGYIVAKLKSYGVRLPAGKAAKELVIFLQGVCELAALDGKQKHLINQLCACMRDTYESGNTNKPTIRSFLFQCVFSAYIECSLSNPAAWILVLPIMETVSRAIHDMIYDIDINDQECIASVSNMFGAILQSILHVLRVFLGHPGYTEVPPTIVIIQSCIELTNSMFPVFDYMNRNGALDAHYISMLRTIRRYSASIVNRLSGSLTSVDPDQADSALEAPVGNFNSPSLLPESRTFAVREIQTCLRSNWSKHDGRYFVLRGRESREIPSDIVKRGNIDIEVAKLEFIDEARMFLHRCAQLDDDNMEISRDISGNSTAYDLLGEGIHDLIL